VFRISTVLAVLTALLLGTLGAPAQAARPGSGPFEDLAVDLEARDLLSSLLDVETSRIELDVSSLDLTVEEFTADGDTVTAAATLEGELLLRADGGELLATVDLSGVSVDAVVEDLRARCSGSLRAELALQVDLEGAQLDLETELGTLSLEVAGTVDLTASIAIDAERGSDVHRLICDIAKQLPITSATADDVAGLLTDLAELVDLTELATLLDGSTLTAVLDQLDLSTLELDTSDLTLDLTDFQADDGAVTATGVLAGTIRLLDGAGEMLGEVDLDRTRVTLAISELEADCSQGDLSFDADLTLELEDATITLDTALGDVVLELSGDVGLSTRVALTGVTGEARSLVCEVARNLPVTEDTVDAVVDALRELLDAV
jgi:hypothetical protein